MTAPLTTDGHPVFRPFAVECDEQGRVIRLIAPPPPLKNQAHAPRATADAHHPQGAKAWMSVNPEVLVYRADLRDALGRAITSWAGCGVKVHAAIYEHASAPADTDGRWPQASDALQLARVVANDRDFTRILLDRLPARLSPAGDGQPCIEIRLFEDTDPARNEARPHEGGNEVTAHDDRRTKRLESMRHFTPAVVEARLRKWSAQLIYLARDLDMESTVDAVIGALVDAVEAERQAMKARQVKKAARKAGAE